MGRAFIRVWTRETDMTTEQILAAVAGKEGDLKALTGDLVSYCRNLI